MELQESGETSVLHAKIWNAKIVVFDIAQLHCSTLTSWL